LRCSKLQSTAVDRETVIYAFWWGQPNGIYLVFRNKVNSRSVYRNKVDGRFLKEKKRAVLFVKYHSERLGRRIDYLLQNFMTVRQTFAVFYFNVQDTGK
jgi:hypothetical protein